MPQDPKREMSAPLGCLVVIVVSFAAVVALSLIGVGAEYSPVFKGILIGGGIICLFLMTFGRKYLEARKADRERYRK